MPWELLQRLLVELAHQSYSGWLALHNYNEPLANPRLLDELALVRDLLPNCKPSIFTNGDFVSVGLVRELAGVGVQYLRITRYPRMSQVSLPSDAADIGGWLQKTGLDRVAAFSFDDARQGSAAVGSVYGMRVEVIAPNISTYNSRGGTTITQLERHRETPCAFTVNSAAIDFRGQLKMCCNVYPDNVAHAIYVVGSVQDQSFADLWSGPRMHSWRSAHAKADWSQSAICQNCTHFLPEQRAVFGVASGKTDIEDPHDE